MRKCTLLRRAQIIEVIVCDHSSDSTPQILASFMAQQRYPMIRLVHHDERGGAASAWNEIFSLASGDIVVLFDADVLPLKDCISELVLCMANNQIGLCASNPICRNPNSSAGKSDFVHLKLVRIHQKAGSFPIHCDGEITCYTC